MAYTTTSSTLSLFLFPGPRFQFASNQSSPNEVNTLFSLSPLWGGAINTDTRHVSLYPLMLLRCGVASWGGVINTIMRPVGLFYGNLF